MGLITFSVEMVWAFSPLRIIGASPPPHTLIFATNSVLHLGWTYRKLVSGPIGNQFVDLLETGLWTYWKLVCGPNGNRFVDLTETGSYPAPKGLVSFSEVGRTETGSYVDLCVNRFVGA